MNLVKYTTVYVCILLCTNLYAQNSSVTNYRIGNFGSQLPGNMCKTASHLYFSADDGIHGLEPWYTDGINPPSIFVDLHPTLPGLHPAYHKMITAQGDLFFVNANHTNPNWPKGTQLYHINTNFIYSLSPGNYTDEVIGVYNDTLILPFYSNSNTFTIGKLNVNTTLVLDTICKINQHWPKEIKQCANRLYYAAYTQSAQYVDVFSINMHSKTPVTVISSLPRSGNDYYNNMVSLGNYMYFVSHDFQFGNELYRHDGNTLERLTDINAGNQSGIYPNNNILFPYNGKIFFSGFDSGMNASLYYFDPVTKNTGKIHNPWTNKAYNPCQFIEYNGKLFFQCLDTAYGAELYVYDGTNPPFLAADVTPGRSGSWPQNMIVFKNDLFFSGVDSSGNTMLFKYNDSALVVPPFPSGVAKTTQDKSYNIKPYPNPTTQDTYLDIQLNEPQTISVKVLDINGRIVHTIHSKLYSPGKHTVNLPLVNMPEGTYFYSIFDKNAGLLSGGQIIKQ